MSSKGNLRVARRDCIIAVLLLCLIFVPVPAIADVVYLYDDLNRLARVIREDGEAATYHYDSVGNILRITRESGIPPTTTGSSSTTSANRSTTTAVTVTGFNLIGASATSSTAGVSIANLRTDLDSLTFDLIVSAAAPLGPATLTLDNGHGPTSLVVQINPAPPQITGFFPLFGAPGATISVSGNFFDDRGPAYDTVLFNGVAAVVQSVTSQNIQVIVPAGAMSGPITVSHGGGSASSSASFVTGQVVATSVSPTSGSRGGTVHVLVSGSNLQGSTLSRPGAPFTNVVASATQVSGDAAITLGAPREDVITVSNQVTTATVAFSVVPGIPIVTSFTPISGGVGDTVNVDGGGFDEVLTATNTVRFNGVLSDIVSVTPTRLVTHVPSGATTGAISVTTPAGTGTSPQNFTVVASAPLQLVTKIDAPFSLPISIAIRPDRLRAYVVSEDRNSVGVVDTTSHAVIATIPVGAFPIHAAVSPDGSRLYVVNTPTQSNADTVTVINLATNSVSITITLGNSNRRGQAFVSPDGRTVIVTHPDQNAISILDATSSSLAAVLTTGVNPVRVAFSPDSARAYIANSATSGSITVLDVNARTIAATIATPARPTFVSLSPDGARLYAINSDTGSTVSVIDTMTNAIVATIANGSGLPAAAVMNGAGTRIFVSAASSPLASGNPALVIINTASNTVMSALQLTTNSFSRLGGLVLTPDDQRLIVSLTVDASVAVIDTATNTVLGAAPLTGSGPQDGVALADSRHVYVLCGQSNTICLVDTTTRTSPDAPIARTGAFNSLLKFTPNAGRGFGKAGFTQELVTSIDTATNTALPNIVIPRAPTRPNPQVVNLAIDQATGAKIYADNSRQIVFADTMSGAVNAVITTPFVPSRVLLPSADGTRLYDLAGSNLMIFDTVNQTQLTTFNVGGTVNDALLSANGSRLYATVANSVKVIDPAGPTIIATIPVATTPTRLAFTAGGQKLLVLSIGTAPTVSVIDVGTSTVAATIALSGVSFADFVATPNGPLAFVANRTNNRIDVLDTNANTVLTSITMSPAPDFLALTPDNARLFAVQSQAGTVTAIDTTTAAALGSLVFTVGGNGLGPPVFATTGRVYIPVRDFDTVLVLE